MPVRPSSNHPGSRGKKTRVQKNEPEKTNLVSRTYCFFRMSEHDLSNFSDLWGTQFAGPAEWESTMTRALAKATKVGNSLYEQHIMAPDLASIQPIVHSLFGKEWDAIAMESGGGTASLCVLGMVSSGFAPSKGLVCTAMGSYIGGNYGLVEHSTTDLSMVPPKMCLPWAWTYSRDLEGMGPDEVATFRIHEQSCIDYIAAFFLAQRLQGEPVRAMWFEHVLGIVPRYWLPLLHSNGIVTK